MSRAHHTALSKSLDDIRHPRIDRWRHGLGSNKLSSRSTIISVRFRQQQARHEALRKGQKIRDKDSKTSNELRHVQSK
jgi:hypothetical protein